MLDSVWRRSVSHEIVYPCAVLYSNFKVLYQFLYNLSMIGAMFRSAACHCLTLFDVL